MIYAFLLGINQLHLQETSKVHSNSTLDFDNSIDWLSERLQGIFNLTYFALDLIKIAAIVVAFSVAYASFRFLKSQIVPIIRSHISYRPKSRDGHRTIEDVEVIEMERSERIVTPYY